MNETNELTTIDIAVLNYQKGSVEQYRVKADLNNLTNDDILDWLNKNTDYNDSMCYFMWSRNLTVIPMKEFKDSVISNPKVADGSISI
jgi:hypothetical protein